MAELLKLLALAAILFVIYKLVFGRKSHGSIFEMHFKDGRMTQHSGKIPERFGKECRAIVKKGKLTCVVRAEDCQPVRLHISANAGSKYISQIKAAYPQAQTQTTTAKA